MPEFSTTSLQKLSTCDPSLQRLFLQVVKHYDCTILVGTRSKEDQDKAYAEGKSKLKWPKSKHNSYPSKAVDAVPFIKEKGGIVWEAKQCYHFAGYVKGVADSMGIKIRCGADWDGDQNISDQDFNDLVHFQLEE